VIEEGNPSEYSGVIPVGRSMPMPMPKPAGQTAASSHTGANPTRNWEEKMTNVEKGPNSNKRASNVDPNGTPGKHMSNEQRYKAGLLNKPATTPQKDNQ